MIVKCDACQTRFKIPDEKVTDKGVKVRCTKCGNTFRVAREGAPAAVPMPPPVERAAPLPPSDPFAAFGQPDPEEDPFSNPTRVMSNPLAGELGAPPPLPSRSASPPPMPAVPGSGLHDELFGSGLEPADRTRTQTRVEPDRSAFARLDAPLTQGTGTTGAFALGSDRALFEMPARPEGRGLLDDVPEAPAPEPSFEEPEEQLGGLSPTELPSQPQPDWGAPQPDWGAPDAGLFDASAPPPPPEPAPAPSSRPPPPAAEAPPPPPPEEEPEAPAGAARLVSGAVVNIAIAGVLLIGLALVGNVYLNEGRLSWSQFSPAKFAQLFSQPPALVTRDVSNGLYDTQAGHPVLFVRGEVENRSKVQDKVKVRVDIYDGEQLLRSAEVYAGASPTPEDLAGIAGPTALDALIQKLNRQAKRVPPKGTAPFLVAFYEYPTDFTGLRLKVTATAEPSKR